jgi:hypothetical protein
MRLFEQQEFREAAKTLGFIFHNFPDDGPSLALLARAVSCLVDPSAARDAVWQLPGK